MITAWLKRRLNRFGRRYDYDTTYMNELAEADPSGGVKLALASNFLRYRFGLPPAPYYAAKIVAVRDADCGACLKLAITMAEEAGVATADLAALVTGAARALPPDMALAARYARAVLDHDLDLGEVIEACERRWGKRGAAGLAAAVISGLFYPTLKRGLGHANSCEPVIAWLVARTGGRGASAHAIPREAMSA